MQGLSIETIGLILGLITAAVSLTAWIVTRILSARQERSDVQHAMEKYVEAQGQMTREAVKAIGERYAEAIEKNGSEMARSIETFGERIASQLEANQKRLHEERMEILRAERLRRQAQATPEDDDDDDAQGRE